MDNSKIKWSRDTLSVYLTVILVYKEASDDLFTGAREVNTNRKPQPPNQYPMDMVHVQEAILHGSPSQIGKKKLPRLLFRADFNNG